MYQQHYNQAILIVTFKHLLEMKTQALIRSGIIQGCLGTKFITYRNVVIAIEHSNTWQGCKSVSVCKLTYSCAICTCIKHSKARNVVKDLN